MPELELPDVRLHYTQEGAGPALTLLHGFTQSLDSWRELMDQLPPAWRIVRLDLRGHGRSRTAAGAPHTLEACAADVEELWRHLGITRSHLAGYSMGGRLALHIAATRPGRLLSLVTIGAHAGLPPAERRRRRVEDIRLAAEIEAEGIEAFVDRWSRRALFAGQSRRGPEFEAALRAQRLANEPEGLAAALRGMGAAEMEPLWRRLHLVGCPALFIAGAEDSAYAKHAQRLAAAVPKGTALLVEGAGHAAHLEQPQAVATALAAHLSRR